MTFTKHSIICTTLLCVFLFLASSEYSFSEGLKDSVKVKTIKRYIRPSLYYNSYKTPFKRLEDTTLGWYRFKQVNIGFYFPLLTKTWIDDDSVKLNTFHWLMHGNMQSSRPAFSELDYQHRMYKITLGMRFIYSQGKNVWFFHFSPFVAGDNRSIENPVYHFAGGVLFSRTVSKNFGYRLGIERAYTFGRRLHLPIIGFRFGPLDKFNVSIYLPRNISFNFPVSKKVSMNIYARPSGGIYTIDNSDSLYKGLGDRITFARKDVATGFQLNVRASNGFSFFLSTGLAHRRNIYFFDRTEPDGSRTADFTEKVKPGMFVSLGFTIRFGKSKQVYNNNVMYDVFNINNLYTPGINNNSSTQDVPTNPDKYSIQKINNIKYKDIEDLMIDDL